MSIIKRYALFATFVLGLVVFAELIFLIREYNLSTSSAKEQFDALVDQLQSSKLGSKELADLLRTKRQDRVKAILLFSFTNGTEYMSSFSPKFVVQSREKEFQLHQPSSLFLLLQRPFYTSQGEGYHLDAVLQILDVQLLNFLLRNLGFAAALLLLGGSIIALISLSPRKLLKKKPPLQKKASLSAPPQKVRTKKNPARNIILAPPVSSPPPQTATSVHKNQESPPEHIEHITSPAETRKESTPVHSESNRQTVIENIPTPHLFPQESEPTLPAENTSPTESAPPDEIAEVALQEVTEPQDFSSEEETEGRSEIMAGAEEKIQEEIQRGRFFGHYLSLLLVEVVNAEPDSYKECYHLLKELLPVPNTLFHLLPSTFLCLLPSTKKEEPEKQARRWQKSLQEGFHISTCMGMSSLMSRHLSPHLFIQEVQAVLEKAKSQNKDFLSFIPDPRKFSELLLNKNPSPHKDNLHFLTLASLSLPSEDDMAEIEDSILKDYEHSLRNINSRH